MTLSADDSDNLTKHRSAMIGQTARGNAPETGFAIFDEAGTNRSEAPTISANVVDVIESARASAAGEQQ